MQTSSNFLFLVKKVCATSNDLKLISFVKNVKKTTTWQNILTVSPKAWAKNGAQLLIYLVLKKLKFMQKRMRKSRFSLNCLVRSETCRHFKAHSENHTAQLSICLKLKPLFKNLNLVVEMGFKTLCAAVVWLEIGDLF